MALKHTHKLPRKLREDEEERKKTNPSMKAMPQGSEDCGTGCKERRTVWREELTSLSMLVGTVATLLAVITPGEGAETGGGAAWHPNHEPGMEGLMNLDYWVVLPIIVMIVTGLIMRIQRHLGEMWKPGDEGPILSRVEEVNFPAEKGEGAAVYN